MGWYTEFSIGDYDWNWRKTVPLEVSLIFYGKHKVIGENEDFTSDSNLFIGYEATVGQAISNLDNLGMTLEFFVSIYETYRKDSVNAGLGYLNGMKDCYELFEKDGTNRFKVSEVVAWIKKMETGTSKNDIECAIQLLKNKIKLESSLYGDESLIVSLDNLRGKDNLNIPNVLEATTFGIFLSYARENLPEIAWLYEIRIILETLNKRVKVKLNLKDWVREGGSLNIIADSIDSLGLKAKTYTKTFDAILGGKGTYNLEYERVKLLNQWKRLKSLSKTDSSKGVKLEEFIASLFHEKFGFEVVTKNLRVRTQELDIILKNTSKDDFIRSLNSPFVLIECKNWSVPVGVSEARIFESKCRDAGNKVNLGFFIAINGVTKPFKMHINNVIRSHINLIVIGDNDIEQFLFSEKLDLNEWLVKLISNQFLQK
jgi:hypothetical protein